VLVGHDLHDPYGQFRAPGDLGIQSFPVDDHDPGLVHACLNGHAAPPSRAKFWTATKSPAWAIFMVPAHPDRERLLISTTPLVTMKMFVAAA